ncbi:hypothetical protein AB0B78_37750 [Streptomyces sp. NPDC040724]|uniref:hypothetical protein n=1 Tax=Streptomyces sp. NPDC040724 TaxID=3155612 RepID=UPI0033F3962E
MPTERLRCLYAEHIDPILGFAMRRPDQADDAADIVAETFLVSWRRIGLEGDLDLLGQARQELEVSPYSARQLIGSIRTAWRLADGPAAGLPPTVPPARSPDCPRHPRPAN